MAGILDEVMDGIAAKEKQEGKTPATPPATPPKQEGTQPPTAGEKPMNTYSDDFQKKYGEKGRNMAK